MSKGGWKNKGGCKNCGAADCVRLATVALATERDTERDTESDGTNAP
jgi:hypothetical protein